MRFLRQNTATRVTVGPFLDVTDGKSPELSLTVTGCHLTLMVDDAGVPTLALDADATASGGNNDMVHVTDDNAGFYDLELTAAQVNYVGRAMLAVIDDDVHLPVFHEFMIVPANVYDSFFGTDKLDVNAAELGGTVQTGRDIGASVLLSSGTGTGQISLSSGAVLLQATQSGVTIPTVTTVGTTTNLTNLPSIPNNWITAAGINTGAITNAKFAAGAIDAAAIADNAIDAGAIAADAITAAKIADGALDAATFAADFYTRLGIVAYGTAQSATGTTLVLASSSAYANDELNGAVIVITGGTTGVGQSRVITDYVGSTDTATVDAWTTTPTGTITYVVFAAAPASATAVPAVNLTQIAGSAVSTSTAQLGVNVVQAAGTAWGSGAITAASIATGAIDADSLAADAGAEIAGAVWNEGLAGHSGAGSAGAALTAAGSAGDPWSATLPGAYGAGTAGKLVGDNLDAKVSTRASQASVDDVPTVAEFNARTLPSADYVVTTDTIAGVTTVGSVTGAVGSVSAGVTLTAGAIDAILDELIGDGTLTVREALRTTLAVLAGKVSGAKTATITFRNVADTSDVVVGTIDGDGNRTAVTVNP